MTNGLGKGSLLVRIISLYWKKRFSREHTKNPKMLMFGLAQTSYFGLWDIILSRVSTSYSYILCKI